MAHRSPSAQREIPPAAALRPLTHKQAKFAKAYVSNGRQAFAAALEAYDLGNKATAASVASQNFNKLNIQHAILALLNRVKPVEEKIVTAIDDALHSGDDKLDAIHHNTRLRAADMASRLVGAYPEEQERATPRSPNVSINIDARTMRFLVLHGRYPTEAEKGQYDLKPLDVKQIRETDATTTCSSPGQATDNNCDVDHKAK